MKLLRFGPPGGEKPGMLDANGGIRSLEGHVEDIAHGALSPKSLLRLAALDPARLPPVAGRPRLGPCVAGTGKLVCIGLNYFDHAAETGLPVPEEPIVFLKATTAISGPDDPVIAPPGATKMDWEVELGIVIGSETSHIREAEALSCIAGYCVVNDVSERAFQMERNGQWTKGKSADTFAPIGPWLVTRDEIPDPGALDLWLEVDGHRYQNGSTRTLIFGVPQVVSYVSGFMRLMPGDIIATGTPPGVGMGQKPPVFLMPGNVMRLGIGGLGEQCQKIVAWPGRSGNPFAEESTA
jgi:2-keto-4-pentenoate hydratase/2-oxohepta-3-ene-1,7-dioic acid hydratase in catechol pathway